MIGPHFMPRTARARAGAAPGDAARLHPPARPRLHHPAGAMPRLMRVPPPRMPHATRRPMRAPAQVPNSIPVIDEDSWKLTQWGRLIGVAVVYVAVWIPMQAAFSELAEPVKPP